MVSDEQQYTRQMEAKVMVLRGSSTLARDILSKEKQLRPSAPYSSRIIKAGALIGDTKVLLSHWDVTVSVVENIKRVRQDNVFGKATRSRVKDILAIFRQRYLAEESVTRALVILLRESFRLPPWIGCYISTPLVQTGYFTMPLPKFLFRCEHEG